MQLKNLQSSFVGKNNFFYETIDSTQKEIWRRIEKSNIEDGTLIFADIQNSGIGTHGRTWYTDEKDNIAFSIYVAMNCDLENLKGLTQKIAEIIVQIIEEKYHIKLSINEPNDIYFNNKKIGGILTETKVYSNKVKHLVVGIGLNTNKTIFPKDIEDVATSIKKEFGIEIINEDFILEFCNRFEKEIMIRRNL